MNKAINLKAIKWDVQQMLTQNPFNLKNIGFIIGFVLIAIVFSGSTKLLIVFIVMLIAVLFHIKRYFSLKKQEKQNEVLFFSKKKNERERNLYSFFTAMFFVWIFRGNVPWFVFSFGIAAIYLSKYIFFIPSIVFKAEGYFLIIEKGFRRNIIDFTYTNKIRFISHRMIFENILDSKIEIKDVEYLPKIDELKEFLSENFGREKVVSAANGQPLI